MNLKLTSYNFQFAVYLFYLLTNGRKWRNMCNWREINISPPPRMSNMLCTHNKYFITYQVPYSQYYHFRVYISYARGRVDHLRSVHHRWRGDLVAANTRRHIFSLLSRHRRGSLSMLPLLPLFIRRSRCSSPANRFWVRWFKRRSLCRSSVSLWRIIATSFQPAINTPRQSLIGHVRKAEGTCLPVRYICACGDHFHMRWMRGETSRHYLSFCFSLKFFHYY